MYPAAPLTVWDRGRGLYQGKGKIPCKSMSMSLTAYHGCCALKGRRLNEYIYRRLVPVRFHAHISLKLTRSPHNAQRASSTSTHTTPDRAMTNQNDTDASTKQAGDSEKGSSRPVWSPADGYRTAVHRMTLEDLNTGLSRIKTDLHMTKVIRGMLNGSRLLDGSDRLPTLARAAALEDYTRALVKKYEDEIARRSFAGGSGTGTDSNKTDGPDEEKPASST